MWGFFAVLVGTRFLRITYNPKRERWGCSLLGVIFSVGAVFAYCNARHDDAWSFAAIAALAFFGGFYAWKKSRKDGAEPPSAPQ